MINYNYKIQNAFSTSSFSLRAMGDYIESRNIQFSKVMDLFNYITDNYSQPSMFTMDDVEQYYLSQGYDQDFDIDSYLTLPRGQITIRAVCQELIEKLDNSYSIEDYTGLEDRTFSLLSPYGTYQTGSVSWSELAEQLKSSFYASQALAASFKAFSDGFSAADRLTIFNESLNTTLANANLYKDVKKYVSGVLVAAKSDADFINGIFNSINLPTLAAQVDDSDVVLPDQCDFSQYTGVTPVTAVSIPVIGPVVSIAKGLWAGVKGVWNALNSWVDKGINKLSDSFINAGNTLFNPYDIYTINPNGNHTVENTFRQFGYEGWGLILHPTENHGAETNRQNAAYLNQYVIPKLKSKWLKMDNYFAECMFRFDDASATGYTSNCSVGLYNSDIRYRLKPMHYKHCLSLLNLYYHPDANPFDYSTIADEVLDLVVDPGMHVSSEVRASLMQEYITNHLTDLYCKAASSLEDNTGEITEEELYLSYIMTDIVHSHVTNLYEYFDGNRPECTYTFNQIKALVNNLGPKIDNADWIKLLTGFNGVEMDKQLYIGTTPVYTYSDGVYSKFIALFSAIMSQNLMKYLYPLDFNFLSYRANKEAWSEPSFAVKTDSQNANNATKLMAATLAIIIATVVIATVGTTMVKRRRALTAARRQDYYRIIGKMQRGEPITPAEAKNFTWLDKKVGISSALSSGIITDETTDDSAVLDSTEAIYTSIK